MLTDIQKAANTHWRMLRDQGVSKAEFVSCLRVMMGDHTGSPFHYFTQGLPSEITHSIFQRQANTQGLLKEWQADFAAPEGISELNASRFLIMIYNSLEEVDALFTNHITPGTTRHKRDDFSDFVTRRPHSKIGWSLHLTVEGNGYYNCIRERFVSKPGDLILLSPDALYDYRREHSCDLWVHQWVYFQQEERWLELLQWPEIGPGIHHIQASASCYHRLKSLFEQISELHLQASEFSEALKKNILEQILIRSRQLAPQKSLLPFDKRIRLIADYIALNFNQSFTIDTLAALVGLSPARLSALFKQQTGSTMLNFRDERRMARAAQLLAQTRQPINKVAETVGYDDPLYFSRCFSQHLNCNPRQYRKKHQHIEFRKV
ncbi:arabinose operon transcriptional regulator AraC [Paraglaciecola arctica]|uniref:AraC family transcriptional regulator, arabinose operon regulatory protein n=1 Tax=Paraglaciecola arctica BSs20135 TaxID=493475 RepID=K6Z2K1_9ALTE|nr:arabinose operon transcriptional regulator AraC [Paraglaciecola arctica]GAC17685.1 AraC family transcriptional regulator, arabinose operon regulatory protein [Paraglaciecola arctica BSs20135]